MAYSRATNVDAGESGDSILQGILDVDTDLSRIYTDLNTHEALTSAAHGVGAGLICGTTLTQTLSNKTFITPVLGTPASGNLQNCTAYPADGGKVDKIAGSSLLANTEAAKIHAAGSDNQTNVTGSSGSCTGNAATATKLATARAINGVDFDGTQAITIPVITLANIYPVGCIYTTTVVTNPATVFGFGTWAAFGEGKVLVGKAAAGTFNTAGATGGEATHTLITAEMPTHTHPQVQVNLYGSGEGYNGSGGGTIAGATDSTGGGGAHNNLQPYIVVYFWERTA